MRNSKKLTETTDSKTYKINLKSFGRGCPICGPRSGCNSVSSKDDRSWKNFRKTQYKS